MENTPHGIRRTLAKVRKMKEIRGKTDGSCWKEFGMFIGLGTNYSWKGKLHFSYTFPNLCLTLVMYISRSVVKKYVK